MNLCKSLFTASRECNINLVIHCEFIYLFMYCFSPWRRTYFSFQWHCVSLCFQKYACLLMEERGCCAPAVINSCVCCNKDALKLLTSRIGPHLIRFHHCPISWELKDEGLAVAEIKYYCKGSEKENFPFILISHTGFYSLLLQINTVRRMKGKFSFSYNNI